MHFINTQYKDFQPFLPGCARDGLGALAEAEVPERQESGDIHVLFAESPVFIFGRGVPNPGKYHAFGGRLVFVKPLCFIIFIMPHSGQT